jgi:hypothetical protein
MFLCKAKMGGIILLKSSINISIICCSGGEVILYENVAVGGYIFES